MISDIFIFGKLNTPLVDTLRMKYKCCFHVDVTFGHTCLTKNQPIFFAHVPYIVFLTKGNPLAMSTSRYTRHIDPFSYCDLLPFSC